MAKIDENAGLESPKNTTDMSEFLKRLEAAEAKAEAAEAKAAELMKKSAEKENPHKDAHEHYKWPREFCYNMWGGIPILDWKSKKKYPARDWTYKNQYWEFVSNHYMVVSLAYKDESGNDKIEVERTEFHASIKKSEMFKAKTVEWKTIDLAYMKLAAEGHAKPIEYYVFKTDKWEIKVKSHCIN